MDQDTDKNFNTQGNQPEPAGSDTNQQQTFQEQADKTQNHNTENASDPRLTITEISEDTSMGSDNSEESLKEQAMPPRLPQNGQSVTGVKQQATGIFENIDTKSSDQSALASSAPTGVSLEPSSQTVGDQTLMGETPVEAKNWNWGAFLLSWIWGIGNGVWIALIALIPPASLVMSIILGIKGGEWAWKTGKFASVEEFVATQKAWTKWGVVAFILFFVVGFIIPMVSALMSFR